MIPGFENGQDSHADCGGATTHGGCRHRRAVRLLGFCGMEGGSTLAGLWEIRKGDPHAPMRLRGGVNGRFWLLASRCSLTFMLDSSPAFPAASRAQHPPSPVEARRRQEFRTLEGIAGLLAGHSGAASSVTLVRTGLFGAVD